jgi:hypothetical protein
MPIFIPPITPQSPPCIIWDWYNRPTVAAVSSGLSLTPPRRIIKKINYESLSDLRLYLVEYEGYIQSFEM